MGYYKNISLEEIEEFLKEEKIYKRIEEKQTALEERKKQEEEFDFERDQGARP